MAIKRMEAVWKFLQAARNLVKNKDMSKESILRFAKQEFGEVSDFLRLQIDNLFRKPKVLTSADKTYKQELKRLEGALGSLDPKQPGFKEAANRLIKKIEDLKNTRKADVVPIKKDEGIMSQYKTIDDEVTQAEKDAIFDNFLANADRTYANFVTKALRDIQKAPKSERQQMIKAIKDRTGMFRYLDDADAEKILKSVDEGFIPIRKDQIDDIESAIKADEGIMATDEAAKVVKKRTDDIAKGDVTGETSDLMTDLEGKAKEIKKAADELKKVADEPVPFMEIAEGSQKGKKITIDDFFAMTGKARDPRLGVVRAAAREILNKNKVNIGREDPIDVLRKMYGEKGLEAVDAVSDSLLDAQSYGEINTILRDNKLFDLVPKKTYGYDQSIVNAEKIRKAKEQEAKNRQILEDFDPTDRTKNADGGLIDILKL